MSRLQLETDEFCVQLSGIPLVTPTEKPDLFSLPKTVPFNTVRHLMLPGMFLEV